MKPVPKSAQHNNIYVYGVIRFFQSPSHLLINYAIKKLNVFNRQIIFFYVATRYFQLHQIIIYFAYSKKKVYKCFIKMPSIVRRRFKFSSRSVSEIAIYKSPTLSNANATH